MPSPVGHALGALAAGWLVVRPESTRRGLALQAAIIGCAGMAPDLDLLIAQHRGESHSVGIAAVVAGLAALTRWPIAHQRWRICLVVFIAWMTHPLLDAFGSDTKAPVGVMAAWPLSDQYYSSTWTVFPSVSRQFFAPAFLADTLTAVTRELLILIPPLALVWWIKKKTSKCEVRSSH